MLQLENGFGVWCRREQWRTANSWLTQAAQQFITPLTFQSVTGRRVYVDADLWGSEGHVQHIGLGRGADLLVIAPISANTLAKLAHGIADNLLSVTSLAARCPILIAPAMDGGMYNHPATQANLEILRQLGVIQPGQLEALAKFGPSFPLQNFREILVGRGFPCFTLHRDQ